MQPVTKKKGDHAMSNMFDMKCPKCGSEEQIDIQAAIWVRVTSDGTDADASGCGDHEYTPDNPACCAACDYTGTVKDFSPPDEDSKDERLREAAPEMFKALELCADVLGELARLDDGTPSISALAMARDAIAKATA
jgi:hypothetical protein